MKKYLLIFIPTLFLIACGAEEQNVNETTTTTTPSSPTENTSTLAEENVNLSNFFMPNNSIARFKGEGNEFATYTLTTKHLYDDYVATYEDNGGTVVERIYSIQPDKISLIAQNGEAYEIKNHTLTELESMDEIEVYLQSPFVVGTDFNGWKITSTSTKLDTTLQSFQDVIVLEKIDQGSISRKYFAKNFGEIKREFIVEEGEEPFIVTSTIEEVS
ncbi:hypothetical protein [Psychrobacillus soli]|uniref:Outer membrane lipoprotein carrier protein LolA n=1 Tax=Psychrobacillus soli TaxID=1543965 RepID=A0A544TMB7_9BACI|nr:hypothetical protein [Psychrobacillus soli]TQR18550.1 hypothetical protein FG383_01495 [Psychrobacillus soli]